MVLTYSIAFDVVRSKETHEPVGLDELWTRVARLLHATLRVAHRLPKANDMAGLYGRPDANLAGEDLDLKWAHEAADENGTATWAATIEHPSGDEKLLWGVDLAGRQQAAGRVQFGLRLRMEALTNVRQPVNVAIRRPRLVHDFLRWFDVERHGLSVHGAGVPWNELPRLRALLTDPARELPVILIGPAGVRQHGTTTKVLPHLVPLAKESVGAAILALVPSEGHLRQFHEGIDRSLHLPGNDQIGIYWPLERGMSAQEIAARCLEAFPIPGAAGNEALTSRIATRLAESLVVVDPGAFTSVATLRARQAAAATPARRERDASFTELQAQNKHLWDEVTRLEKKCNGIDVEKAEQEKQLRGLKLQLFGCFAEKPPTEAQPPDWEQWEIKDMATAMAIAIASPWLRDRLVFTDVARKTGPKADYQRPTEVLAALHFLGGTFLDHVRSGSAQDLDAFAALHKFELAMVETGHTRRMEKWMRERDADHQGVTYRCEAHLKLKIGRAKNSGSLRLSIHFALDHAGSTPRIIVGHIGEHLTTATSRNW